MAMLWRKSLLVMGQPHLERLGQQAPCRADWWLQLALEERKNAIYDERGSLGAGGDGATTMRGGFGHHVAVESVDLSGTKHSETKLTSAVDHGIRH
jgi:hypothetical protein